MTQQFRIDSESLRDKINSLLPSQSRGGIDVDLSGQTTIVPIVDLTETAEGSSLRQDLQTAFSHKSATVFNISNATTTIINTTGYYKLICTVSQATSSSANSTFAINITDGTTVKALIGNTIFSTAQNGVLIPLEIIFKLEAGDSLTITSGSTRTFVRGSVRQIADVNGNLTNP